MSQDGNVFTMSSVDEALEKIDLVREVTDEHGFSLIRGAVALDQIAKYRARVGQLFQPTADLRVTGDYKRNSPDLQRLDLGEYRASTRFARYFIFFSWNQNDVFTPAGDAQMRIFNRLSRLPTNFGMDEDTNGNRFRVTMVLQYPHGGGFMSKHREYDTEKNDRAYVVYFPLTSRGADYSRGGAYVHVGDRKVDIDAIARAGDIVVYRGDYYHGVDGVDADQPVDLGSVNGRMMMTTVVKYLT
jgi:hypothetical protein